MVPLYVLVVPFGFVFALLFIFTTMWRVGSTEEKNGMGYTVIGLGLALAGLLFNLFLLPDILTSIFGR